MVYTILPILVKLRLNVPNCFPSIYLAHFVLGESMETQPLFWKSVFFSNFSSSIDRYAIENRFGGRNHFVTYACNTRETGRYLETPMNEADLLDSLDV